MADSNPCPTGDCELSWFDSIYGATVYGVSRISGYSEEESVVAAYESVYDVDLTSDQEQAAAEAMAGQDPLWYDVIENVPESSMSAVESVIDTTGSVFGAAGEAIGEVSGRAAGGFWEQAGTVGTVATVALVAGLGYFAFKATV